MKAAIKSGKTNESGKQIARFAVVLLAGWMALSSAQAQTVAIATTPAPAKEKSWVKKIFGRQDWTEVDHAYTAPREICHLVENNISYTTEATDNWSPAAATWNRGKGDCEDMAICVQDLCRASGISTKVHLYFPANGREGHAVLVGEWGGKTWFSSNGSYEEVKSEQDVRRRVAKMLSCKESQLWVMKLNESDVAKYIAKSPAHSVAAASPR